MRVRSIFEMEHIICITTIMFFHLSVVSAMIVVFQGRKQQTTKATASWLPGSFLPNRKASVISTFDIIPQIPASADPGLISQLCFDSLTETDSSPDILLTSHWLKGQHWDLTDEHCKARVLWMRMWMNQRT